MFEKEAEEYKLSHTHYEVAKRENGAEYAKSVIDVNIQEAFQQGTEFGYNKANEWHYVKDGSPKDNEYVLIYTDIKNVYIARLVEDDYFITNKGGFVQTSAVIAWKEIVLPKER